jgi:hypothetical protein
MCHRHPGTIGQDVAALVALDDSDTQVLLSGVHVSNILRKLGVTSRVDAAAIAQRVGGG